MDYSCIKPFPPENVSADNTYYSLGDDCIVVHSYVQSSLETEAISIAQDMMPSGETVFYFAKPFDGNLALKICDNGDVNTADPSFASDILVTIDKEEYDPAVDHGYMLIAGPFDAGCRIVLSKTPDTGIADEPASQETVSISDNAHESTGFSRSYKDASILYSESKKRYVLKINDGNGAHAILPDGTEVFARAGEHAFKGYKMRIHDDEYDLVVMREDLLSEKALRCNAYMPVLGSFSGDCCYCIDSSHPAKSGTHGVIRGTSMIDSETGYKWGRTSKGTYDFELENGMYNVYTIETDSSGNKSSNKCVKKVTDGTLELDPKGNTFSNISITAADSVISEETSYSELKAGEKVLEAAYLYITDAPQTQRTANKQKKTAVSEPKFEHIIGSGNVRATGIEKDTKDADSYVFSPLSGNRISRREYPDPEKNKGNNTSRSGIRVSSFAPESPVAQNSHISTHITNTIKARKAKNAAIAAGVAAGAALLGGIAKMVSGRKK